MSLKCCFSLPLAIKNVLSVSQERQPRGSRACIRADISSGRRLSTQCRWPQKVLPRPSRRAGCTNEQGPLCSITVETAFPWPARPLPVGPLSRPVFTPETCSMALKQGCTDVPTPGFIPRHSEIRLAAATCCGLRRGRTAFLYS